MLGGCSAEVSEEVFGGFLLGDEGGWKEPMKIISGGVENPRQETKVGWSSWLEFLKGFCSHWFLLLMVRSGKYARSMPSHSRDPGLSNAMGSDDSCPISTKAGSTCLSVDLIVH